MNKLVTLETRIKNIKSSSSKIRKFLDSILDEKSFVELDAFMSGKSFLDDSEALGEGVVTGYATINEEPVYLFAHNQEVLNGSFCKAQSEKILKVINLAISNSVPVVAILDSNGARVGEGVSVLEAYSAVINAITIATEEVPVISIIKGNCVGLMSAIAALSDFTLMSKDSVLSLNAPSVVAAKANTSAKLSDVLGAKSLGENSNLCSFQYKDNISLKVLLHKLIAVTTVKDFPSQDDPNRITTSLNTSITKKKLISALCDKDAFLEMSADYAKELVCGLATINGIYCGIIMSDSSINASLTRQGIDKFNNIIELLEKYNLPLVSLVDCDGLESNLELEQSGIAIQFARLMSSISISSMPKVAIICGKAIGAAYSLFASKSIGYDYVLAFENSEITPIDASVAVNIMYSEDIKKAKDTQKARNDLMNKYSQLAGNPLIAAQEGFIDNVIKPSDLRPYVASSLLMLLGL